MLDIKVSTLREITKLLKWVSAALGDKLILFDTVNKWHSALTTTSPNSLLLASLDGTQSHLSDEGIQLASKTVSAITKVRKMIKKCKL